MLIYVHVLFLLPMLACEPPTICRETGYDAESGYGGERRLLQHTRHIGATILYVVTNSMGHWRMCTISQIKLSVWRFFVTDLVSNLKNTAAFRGLARM